MKIFLGRLVDWAYLLIVLCGLPFVLGWLIATSDGELSLTQGVATLWKAWITEWREV